MSARRHLSLLSLGTALAMAPSTADAVDLDWTFKATAAGIADGGRDLGLLGRSDGQQGYLDVTPWLHVQFSDRWSALLRVRVFAPTDAVLVAGNDNNNVGATAQAYIGLKEAWVDYRGLTSYPGESLRFGRQRLREDDALWWDQDFDAARWILDSTLLQVQLGAGRQLNSYRSDGAAVPAAQRDRTYTFATISTEPLPGTRVGLRALHADDDAVSGATGARPNADAKLSGGHLTWLGFYGDNHAYDAEQAPDLSYWGSVNGLTGSRHQLQLAPNGTFAGETRDNPLAWAAEAGVRWRLPLTLPIQIGAAYTYSGGGGDGQYGQSGLQSNYSRYTGTNTLLHRYTDAYRAELGNLQAATAFASLSTGPYETAAVFNDFRRPDRNATVIADGISVRPQAGGASLGRGYDLVVTRFFGASKVIDKLEPADDTRSSLRLRASLFDPGAAYGPAAKSEYRVTLEATLWY